MLAFEMALCEGIRPAHIYNNEVAIGRFQTFVHIPTIGLHSSRPNGAAGGTLRLYFLSDGFAGTGFCGFDACSEFFLKLFPSNIEIGSGISSEEVDQP
jgi:hypothetical protein